MTSLRGLSILALLLAGCTPASDDSAATNAVPQPETVNSVARAAALKPPAGPNVRPPVATAHPAAPPARPRIADLPPTDDGIDNSMLAEANTTPPLPVLEDLPASNAAAAVVPFPDEVTAFMVDRDACDHFRSEDAYDEDRKAFLAENVRALCTGSDARLADLRHRYAEDPDVVTALRSYDDRIESPERGRTASSFLPW